MAAAMNVDDLLPPGRSLSSAAAPTTRQAGATWSARTAAWRSRSMTRRHPKHLQHFAAHPINWRGSTARYPDSHPGPDGWQSASTPSTRITSPR
jgi:hypothetical protein